LPSHCRVPTSSTLTISQSPPPPPNPLLGFCKQTTQLDTITQSCSSPTAMVLLPVHCQVPTETTMCEQSSPHGSCSPRRCKVMNSQTTINQSSSLSNGVLHPQPLPADQSITLRQQSVKYPPIFATCRQDTGR
jgi:hypothetical protein